MEVEIIKKSDKQLLATNVNDWYDREDITIQNTSMFFDEMDEQYTAVISYHK